MKAIVAAIVCLLPVLVAAAQIGYDGARHLLNRTGFGATETEVRQFASLERGGAVEQLLSGARREASVAPPAFATEPVEFYRVAALDEAQRKEVQRRLREHSLELRAWWMREMLLTPSPLTERMTLFWHGHFASSQQKVRSPQLMYRQNALLRREALGNFGTLLHAVSRDAAMLIYLDNATSRKQAPNENFAREVMELFTLGEGHYGEADVKEAARSFTGWSLERRTGEFAYRRVWHDYGEKSVLGRTGRFDGDDVIDILLQRPETARFIAAKLWKEFVSSEPDPREVERWAGVLRGSRYEMKPLLRAILTSDAFWADANRGALVKTPVDLVVGTLHTFSVNPFDLRPAVFACAVLGQNLFSPPNVKGWPTGTAWIDSATLLGRKQWLERAFRGEESMTGGGSGAGMEKLLLALPPSGEIAQAMDGMERVRAIVGDPAYQLK